MRVASEHGGKVKWLLVIGSWLLVLQRIGNLLVAENGNLVCLGVAQFYFDLNTAAPTTAPTALASISSNS